MAFEGKQDLDAAMREYLDNELIAAARQQLAAVRAASASAPATAEHAVATLPAGPATRPDDAAPALFRDEIAALASRVLKIPVDRLDLRENMSRYGVDSIIVTELMKSISDVLGQPIAPTVFFEARHLDELADILYRRYRSHVEACHPRAAAPEPASSPGLEVAPKRAQDEADAPAGNAADWISRFRAARATAQTGPDITSGPVQAEAATRDYEPVAIIAMDGVFPDSSDLAQFEQHLRRGDDCISEVPPARWDWREVYGDPSQGELTRVKFGGFAPDIDQFDPLFFGMSPREAELMDPQHRLFIQSAWRLIESAGYAPKSLAGRKIGIFLGINLQDYAHLVDQGGAMEAMHLTSLGHMFCPNRLSFLLDLHGPSQVIDTACSSSLVALHRAVLSIQHEDCEMAIAGGANLLISPDMHIMYSKVGMICEDGRCKTFSGRANGYVRADGVGAVLLKRLKRAEQDGDTILAVIRGSAENHGGMSTSLTAPNPKAQASLIVEAHRKAGSDPRSIGYIECHGTGTALGDPIEINGLKMAFAQLHQDAGLAPPEQAYCGLGSVKSNIGHAETAAGIAGVIKTVLALRHQQLYQSLHCADLNPMIDLAQSPFFILQQGQPWTRAVIDGHELPRRAGVSSFGAGGSNAHVVIEEYLAPAESARPPAPTPALILLSAKNQDRLDESVARLLHALQRNEAGSVLADLAYTLQVGREAMPQRLALIADSMASLTQQLAALAAACTGGQVLVGSIGWQGHIKQGRVALRALGDEAAQAALLLRHGRAGELEQLAKLWIMGADLGSQEQYEAQAGHDHARPPRRVMLPTYPFARQRYWLPVQTGHSGNSLRDRREASMRKRVVASAPAAHGGIMSLPAPAGLHPLLQQNTSDLHEQRFSARFDGSEFFLRDHVVAGRPVLPGVAYLEMARAAVCQTAPDMADGPLHLKNVVWARPFTPTAQALHIGLSPAADRQIAYRIYSQPDGAAGQQILHSQGMALAQAAVPATPVQLDLDALRVRFAVGHPEALQLTAAQCYAAFEAMSIRYGRAHQCLDAVYFSAPQQPLSVLARVTLQDRGQTAEEQAYLLHPGLIDAGLQACIGLLAAAGRPLPSRNGSLGESAALPFALDHLSLLTPPPRSMWVWIRHAGGRVPGGRLQKLDIDFCDEAGRICLCMRGFSSRAMEAPADTLPSANDNDAMLMCRPRWQQQSPAEATTTQSVGRPAWGRHLVLLCDIDGRWAACAQALPQYLPGARCEHLRLHAGMPDAYGDAAEVLLERIQTLLAERESGPGLLQLVLSQQGDAALLAGLSGMLKTINRESRRCFGQLIEISSDGPVEQLAAALRADGAQPEQAQIRYLDGVRQVLHWQEYAFSQLAGPAPAPWKPQGVYLISGGGGQLGLMFAQQILANVPDASIILCGRTEVDEQTRAGRRIADLTRAGAAIRYRCVDVSVQAEVLALISEIEGQYGRLDGILHCAGLLRDNFIYRKSAAELRQVLAPKVAGTIHLDAATAHLDLDFLLLFSSAAGAWGSAGQADYAAANGFLDVFAEQRNAKLQSGARRGRTFAINWPLWAGGGMRMEAAAQRMMRQNTGMSALPDALGLQTCARIMASNEARMMLMHGDLERIRPLLATSANDAPAAAPMPAVPATTFAAAAALRGRIEQLLLQAVAAMMKFALEDIDADAQFSDYGFDSISFTEFASHLNQHYQLELTPTVFFEHPTIAEMAAWLGSEHGAAFAAPVPFEQAEQAQPVATTFAAAAALRGRIEQLLLQAVAAMMKFALEDIDTDAQFSDYGFDSISFTEFASHLNQHYHLELTPTVFFEHPTIAEMAAWLSSEHGAAFAAPAPLEQAAQTQPVASRAEAQARARFATTSMPTEVDVPAPLDAASPDHAAGVAIIGMSGRFPMAADLDAYWQNLLAGRDCISEIPPDRWDWREFHGDPASQPNKTNVKWGGFIDGVGDFDAGFFGVSPREAELMDPQQRLLMEYVWKAIEDAGYAPGSLSGSNTGLFIGTASSGYGEMAAQGGCAIDSYSSTGVVGSVGPNRMSYFLNLHGPSEPIETACSSSLVALHRALTAMACGDCEQAIVGGINLIICPETQISFSKAGMLCEDGRCKTFSSKANGYVRGEGVGMLMIKKLPAAQRDGDHIYAVIRASAENHGGRASSLTAPNPKAQAELIRQAYTRAGIDPRTVGYIEAHGTGTALGDPIEIASLKTAFKALYQSAGAPGVGSAHCALGAVKTNIGHLELAAGVAGLIKVLLQLKHKTLVKSLHCDEINPHIQLKDSPFYLLHENRAWDAPLDAQGQALPRRAGVSSFGFGGVNAHIVLEEYLPPAAASAPELTGPAPTAQMLLLSAKHPERLQAGASALLAMLEGRSGAAGAVAAGTGDGNCEPQRVLTATLRTLLATILQIARTEISAAQPLEDYGVDALHRSLLHERLQQSQGLELPAWGFLRSPSLAVLAASLLEEVDGLREHLLRQPAPAVDDDQGEPAAVPMAMAGVGLPALEAMAYTLQVGRDSMEERLAMLVSSHQELAAKLRAFLAGSTAGINGLYTGQARQHKRALAAFAGEEAMQEVLTRWMQQGKYAQVLEAWSNGLQVDWQSLYQDRPRPNRVALPGYSFLRRRHWALLTPRCALGAASRSGLSPPTPALLHALVHENQSSLSQCRYITRFSGTEFFLADHQVQGCKVLPGVAYLEIARAAAALALDGAQSGICLRDVVWLKPFAVSEAAVLQIDLVQHDGAIDFRISRPDQAKDGSSLHAQGQIYRAVAAASAVRAIDVTALQTQPRMQRQNVAACYALFASLGLAYGPAHQVLEQLYASPEQVLAKLALPGGMAATLEQYVLHPALMDGALQSCIGLSLAMPAQTGGPPAGLALPFAIDSVEVLAPCTASMWAWVRRTGGTSDAGRIQKLDIDLCRADGSPCVLLRGFTARLLESGERSGPLASMPQLLQKAPEQAPQLPAAMIAHLRQLLAKVLKMPAQQFAADTSFDSYGLDSMTIIEVTRLLEKSFGPLSKTLFFEYQTLTDLAGYFIGAHRPAVQALLTASDVANLKLPSAPTPAPELASQAKFRPEDRGNTGPLDIAIVGLSGRYPQADNLAVLWDNLRAGRDCVTEVPPQRWDWQSHYSTDRSQEGRHFCKWGGFIDGIDEFDPLFFNIAPGVAPYMDPQERLFLQHAWMAMEDAGYRRQDLGGATPDQEDDGAAQVGVYAGVMYSEYQWLAIEASRAGQGPTIANFHAGVANRVSYSLNLDGPSMTVDTMCSSSLTAIHLACQDLRQGRIAMALAGGVNVSVHPNKYTVLSQGQFIAGSGRCASFGADGEGYVPSEGVGVVLLKRLADAERDGDHIYGVIKGSALNHGGKSNGFSVPNPHAQQRVIGRALRESQLDPRAITYIEAHGTGTRLGDPIEISALSKAFGKYAGPGQHCWLGSIKSNIGHAESAAGIAGLSKVLLQMREGMLAPSLHADTLNPFIDFAATPFEVNRQLRLWPRPQIDGQTRPRAAGLSSFGAGGSNAHLIIEEYLMPAGSARVSHGLQAFVLSAASQAQLREQAAALLAFLRQDRYGPARLALADVAYTLQCGREALAYRLALAADSFEMLMEKLDAFGRGDHARLHLGHVKLEGEAASPAAPELPLEDVLAAWTAGFMVDWSARHAAAGLRAARVSLPTYPFARERYWLEPARPLAPITSVAPQSTAPATEHQALLLQPRWEAQSVLAAATQPDGYAERWLCFADDLGTPLQLAGVTCLTLRRAIPEAGLDAHFGAQAEHLLEVLQALLRRKPQGRILLQVVDRSGTGLLAVPLAAMLKTATLENPLLVGQFIALESSTTAAAQQACLELECGAQPQEQQIRYRQGQREVLRWSHHPTSAEPALPWKQGGTYLITGGAGGLGLLLANEIVRRVGRVRLILTGRAELGQSRLVVIEAMRSAGARVEYARVDVCDAGAVAALVESICASAGPGEHLNGIIHGAGVLRDNFILRKDAAELREVLAPKVSGTLNLDLASRGIALDFFVMLSSVAAAGGNSGQADYATANAFMDSYAAYRNGLQRAGVGHVLGRNDAVQAPQGHSLSINWPLWQAGGMDIDARSKELMWQHSGLVPMRTATGIAALYQALAGGAEQVMVLEGDTQRLSGLFGLNPGGTPEQQPEEAAAATVAVAAVQPPVGGRMAVEQLLMDLLCRQLVLPRHRLHRDVPLEQYGLDSVAMTRLTAELEKTFGSLPKTLFFEYPSVQSCSDYLSRRFPEQAAGLLPATSGADADADADGHQAMPLEVPVSPVGPAASPASRDIAVIAMSGRFPQAPDLDSFWENLVQGRDCITEIPPQRWDYRTYFDSNKDAPGKSYCKWGGFLDEVDQFDPLFFKVSPQEAELLDPQERLFMETVWNLMESAGYQGETLQRLCQSQVGVFVGAMSQQYHAFQADPVREALVAMSSYGSIANRTSYFFNFHGPSVAIDTMCSSALTAIHMACESLLKGECRVAVAGGVNLSIHPKKYLALAAARMLGSDPYSRSFSQGDGYLPAEAVGAVLLKPLAAAEADNDRILGVLKATALNHGGQSNGYYVPNGGAQADLIADNFARAGIDPRTVSYVESAANGAVIGDQIELNALSAGFARYTGERQFCAIGSVKSNIGHAEAASGISQLIKVLLQLQHRQLVPSLLPGVLNTGIDFSATPFRLQRTLQAWERPTLRLADGSEQSFPLRATVSAFGAGGSNAHLIVEEYVAGAAPASAGHPAEGGDGASQHAQLVLLSARSATQLTAMERRLLAFLDTAVPAPALADLAYTLQTGRESMEYRLALIVSNLQELRTGLRQQLQQAYEQAPPDGVPQTLDAEAIFSATPEQDNGAIRRLMAGDSGQAMLDAALAAHDLHKLALYWVNGVRIQWQGLHTGEAGRPTTRIALPTYPFSRRRYWLGHGSPDQENDPPPGPAWVDSTSVRTPQQAQDYLTQALAPLLALSPEAISMQRGLLDYGVNSISATHLRRQIEQQLQVSLSARDLATHASLAELAVCLATRCQAQDAAVPPAAVPELPETVLATKRWPLSVGQQGLWLLQQTHSEMSAYNVPLALRFGADMRLDLLQQAWRHVLARHPLLNAAFTQHEGEVYRIQPAAGAATFEHGQFSDATPAGIAAALRQCSKQPFDLARGPLWRIHVLSAPDSSVEQHYLVLTVHHIVLDGSSALLLLRDLSQAYLALASGRMPALLPAASSYDDFVAWQQAFMVSAQGQAQLQYWREQLAGAAGPVSLPCDFPRPAVPRFAGASHLAILPAPLAQRLRELASARQIGLPALFLGTLQILLQRYSGEPDISVGMPVSGRPQQRFDEVLGYFVNMLVMRSQLDEQQPAVDFLRGLQLRIADGLDHGDYPFPALQQALHGASEQRQGRMPLFEVMFAYQNFAAPAMTPEQAWPARLFEGVHQEGSHEFALEVYPQGDGFSLRMDYRTDLFATSTIERAMRHYCNLLATLCDDPHTPLGALNQLSPQEWRQITQDWSHGAALPAALQAGSVVTLFRQQAARTPKQAALLLEGQTLTYAELERRSTCLAAYLLQAGIGRSEPVGVCLRRSLDMVVCMFGIFKAGALYVPIAPDYPPQRIGHICADSGLCLLLTDAELRDGVLAESTVHISPDRTLRCLDMASLWPLIEELELPALPQPEADWPAYVIYTSGSTGLPRGVLIGHGAISHHCQVIMAAYDLSAADRVLQFASTSVDASLEQLLPALLCGASVVLRPETIWTAQECLACLQDLAVSVIDLPPPYMHELLLAGAGAPSWPALPALRLAIVGGEVLTAETIALWRASPLARCRLLNAYGPTETTITSTLAEVGMQPESPLQGSRIGRPLAGETAYILDASGRTVPAGVAGELCLGGSGLALGYLNAAQRTAQKFVAHPELAGVRIYRTGDCARWLGDGSIVFMGRLDHQVKIRGFRVECGEVEAALQAHALVRQAVVLAQPEPCSGTMQLVAYVVLAQDAGAHWQAQLRQSLSSTLAEPMLPTVFVALTQIPVLPGGKVDRIALGQLDTGCGSGTADAAVAPRTPLERQLAGIWQQVLGRSGIGVHDDFFALGGHSLLALRLMALISRQLGADLPLASLLQAASIAAQAQLLQQQLTPWSALVCLQPRGALAPWFCVHGVAGNVLCYRELAAELGSGMDRPFYALQAPALESGLHAGNIEGLAALYIAAIRSVQEQGPYHLGGWSMGGLIAYEMARQLRQAGHQVARLALIDSYTPAALAAQEQHFLTSHSLAADDHASLLLTFAQELRLSRPLALASILGTSADTLDARLQRLLTAARHDGLLPADSDDELWQRQSAMLGANLAAMARYIPPTYDGRVLQVQTGQASHGSGSGWTPLLKGAVQRIDIAGDHYSILTHPDIAQLADAVRDYFDEDKGCIT